MIQSVVHLESKDRESEKKVSCILPIITLLIRDLTNGRRQRQRKRHLKIYLFHLCYFAIVLTRSTSTLVNEKLPMNQIGSSGVQVKKENENVTVPSCLHVLHKTLNLVISRCCFAEDRREMYQNLKRTCRAIVFAY